jgi:hypothetical protein
LLSVFAIGIALQIESLKTEAQLTLCESYKTVAQKLELSKWKESREFESFLLDNPNLDLLKFGWVVRVRIDSKSDSAEITLKKNTAINYSLEDVSFSSDDKIASKPKCENDLHGNHKKLACKISHEISMSEFKTISKSKKYKDFLNKSQLEWLLREGVRWPTDLELAGPFKNKTYETLLDKNTVALDYSSFGPNAEFLEISSRVEEKDEIVALGDLEELAGGAGVSICADQHTSNSRKKLEAYFHKY